MAISSAGSGRKPSIIIARLILRGVTLIFVPAALAIFGFAVGNHEETNYGYGYPYFHRLNTFDIMQLIPLSPRPWKYCISCLRVKSRCGNGMSACIRQESDP